MRKTVPPERARWVGELIRVRRGQLEMSVDDLAAAADLGRSTVTRAELGERVPYPKNRGRLERALGWPSGALTNAYDRGIAPVPQESPPAELAALAGLQQYADELSPEAFARLMDVLRHPKVQLLISHPQMADEIAERFFDWLRQMVEMYADHQLANLHATAEGGDGTGRDQRDVPGAPAGSGQVHRDAGVGPQ